MACWKELLADYSNIRDGLSGSKGTCSWRLHSGQNKYEGGWRGGINGHNQQWIDGSIPMVSIDTIIDTFGLIFVNVIDPSDKYFFYF
jgi:hypothetical protein